MLVNVHSLPRIADPHIADGLGGRVALDHHVVRELSLLGLVLVLRSVSELAVEVFSWDCVREEQRC